MPSADFLLLILIPVALAGSALCSASETALFSLSHSDRLQLRRLSPGAASAVATLWLHPRRLLILILLFNTTVNSLYAAIASVMVAKLPHPAAAAAVGIAAVLLLLVFGEVLPKALASLHRVSFARRLARPARALQRILFPVISAVDGLILGPLSRLFAPAESSPRGITAEELSAVLDMSQRQGVIDADEQRLLLDVVEMGSLQVRDVMTPRVDIVWLAAASTYQQLLETIRRTGHTKFPVYLSSPEADVAGLLNAKRYLSMRTRARDRADLPVAAAVEPIRFVPDRIRLESLLRFFRETRSHVALCVDEHGTITGLVEVEDAVAALVSPGESDGGNDTDVASVGPESWVVSGRLGVRELAQLLRAARTPMPERRVSTVAGLILAALGRMPRVGDEVTLGNLLLHVESLHGRAIGRVRVSLAGADPVAPSGAAA